MNKGKIKLLLDSVKKGTVSIEDALGTLRHLPYEDMKFAKVDHHRHIRQGIPEVVYASGKTTEQIVAISSAMYKRSGSFLVTKATKEIFEALGIKGAVFHETSGVIAVGKTRKTSGNILVLTAGTSDMPVAEEAAVTASFLGSKVSSVYDVGVAGLHRLLDNSARMRTARVIVVVAGMEGALPSVVGGMTDKPIVAVPTSTGYGTSLGGLTALFAMLNSCVPGIAVMNIDNGFGAGCLAHKINTR